MAGGDLLYILAFIILPTAVLVSCIWALILLRKGVLLPVRRAPVHDPAGIASDERTAAVEETGEHEIVEALPSTTAEVVDISAEVDSQPEASPALSSRSVLARGRTAARNALARREGAMSTCRPAACACRATTPLY